MFDILVATRSDRGQRTANEDAVRTGVAGGCRYVVLSDGAGGHRRGAEAAARVVGHIETVLRSGQPFAAKTLTHALLSAHRTLQAAQIGAHGLQRMHATVVALWIDVPTQQALWSHAGDTRLYRFRYGAEDVVTVDDSVVQRMLLSDVLTPAQAKHHPNKSQLLAAMGMEDSLQPHTVASPVALEDGDAFLLCTDGWWEALGDGEMAETLGDAETAEDWLDAMQHLIRGRAPPTQDNFSAVAVWVSDPTQITQSMPDLD